MIICADDYGMNENINKAILQLCERRKLQAVSVLVEHLTPSQASDLKKFKSSIQIGLHLNLFSHNPFFWQKKIKDQFLRFNELFGFFPSYVDGHQHCHIYPWAKKCLIEYLSNVNLSQDFYVRSVNISNVIWRVSPIRKTLYLYWLHILNTSFRNRLIKKNISMNNTLWGVFNNNLPIKDVYELAKISAGTNDIFILHPSIKNEPNDLARKHDYELFS